MEETIFNSRFGEALRSVTVWGGGVRVEERGLLPGSKRADVFLDLPKFPHTKKGTGPRCRAYTRT